MPDAAERLVNLALFIASSPEPVTAAHVRARVAGYPAGQADAAFLRMFERDKEDLLASGIALRVVRSGEVEAYVLDRDATFAGEIELSPQEALALRTAAGAVLDDPSFPYARDLRLALAKVSAAAGGAGAADGALVASRCADEAPEAQAAAVAALTGAISSRKRVRFDYTKAAGTSAPRRVDPYGVFARDGRWYLVGRDADADAVRVFAVPRIEALEVETARPKSPDFEPPQDFDITVWMLLPFQFGDERGPATLRLTGSAAARAGALARGQGRLEPSEGAVIWHVDVADPRALATWAIENGPGIQVLQPPAARDALIEGLRAVVTLHAR